MKRVNISSSLIISALLAMVSLNNAESFAQTNNSTVLPISQQNALVGKYCAVCHDDAKMVGGFSLQHFDAINVDSILAAMMASKIKDGAFGASGIPMPDQATQDALRNALLMKAANVTGWTVSSESQTLTLKNLQQVHLPINALAESNLYSLTLTCRLDTGEAELRIAWAPGDVPKEGAVITIVADGKATAHKVSAGQGFAVLYSTSADGVTKPVGSVPEQILSIGNLFPQETASFSFDTLPTSARLAFAGCLGKRVAP
jgi:hypothetical protein